MVLIEVGEIVVHEDLALPVLLQLEGDVLRAALAELGRVGAVEDGLGAAALGVGHVFHAVGVVDLRRRCVVLKTPQLFVAPVMLTLTSLTFSENQSIPMPMGMKATPMTKKVGRTVPAVRMGCQAGRRCCLKALSGRALDRLRWSCNANAATLALLPLGFLDFFLSGPLAESMASTSGLLASDILDKELSLVAVEEENRWNRRVTKGKSEFLSIRESPFVWPGSEEGLVLNYSLAFFDGSQR